MSTGVAIRNAHSHLYIVYIYIYIYTHTRAEASLKVAEKGGEGGEERRGVRGKEGIGEEPAGGGKAGLGAGGWELWAVGSGSEGKRSFNM